MINLIFRSYTTAFNPWIKPVGLALSFLALSGCTTNSKVSTPTDIPAPTGGSTVAKPDRAVAIAMPDLMMSGTVASSDERRLNLANTMIALQYIELSHDLLNEIRLEFLPENRHAELYHAMLSVNITLGNAQQALAWAQRARQQNFDSSPKLQMEIVSLTIDVFQSHGMAFEAALAALDLASLSENIYLDKIQRQNNSDKVWASLDIDKALFDELAQTPRLSSIAQGWLSLKRNIENELSLANAQIALRQWQQDNANHQAAKALPTILQTMLRADLAPPQHIALVLPLSGSLSNVSNAIIDGYTAAYYAKNKSCGLACVKAPITLIDSQAVTNWRETYEDLATAGIELVIGPLAKKNVNLLAAMNLPIPTLALNYVTNPTPSEATSIQPKSLSNKHPFMQFGLSIERETAQLAKTVFNDQHNEVIVLALDRPWAFRAAQAFQTQWFNLTKKSVDHIEYSGEGDYAKTIKQALEIDHSDERHKQIQRIAGTSLNFESRRRQDVDAVVVFGLPKDARQLVPTFAFFDAAAIPVYGSHHIYEGPTQSNRDIDLNQLSFTETPWLLGLSPLRSEVEAAGRVSGPLARLTALGADAFTIQQHYKSYEVFPKSEFNGHTGQLMHENNTIWGRLTLARFLNGQPLVQQSPNELQ